MSILQANGAGLGGAGDPGGALGSFYSTTIDQSLRFNDDDSASLSNASFSTPTDNQNWTWSAWIKLSTISTDIKVLFQADTSSVDVLQIADHKLSVTINGATTTATTMLLRDPSSWYHVVWNYDGSNSKLYVNGELQVTVSKTGNTKINNASYTHYIGTNSTARYFDGYMAEVNFIDGTALDPTSFGETIGGVWVPKEYSGSYGNNGFYLPYSQDLTAGNSISFSGTSDRVEHADATAYDIGASDDFTIEFFFKTSEVGSGAGHFMGNYATGGPHHLITYSFSGSTRDIYFYSNNGQALKWSIAGDVTVSNNTWHHVVFQRNGTVLRAYIDGTRLTTVANTSSSWTLSDGKATNFNQSYNLAHIRLGNVYTTNPIIGSLSNVRYVIGNSVYADDDSDITVPTAILTAVTGTKLLTAVNATLGDDISTENNDGTTSGSPTLSYDSPFTPNNFFDDASGNGNDFTATNLAASDVVPDSPTNNFATFNPLDISGTTLTYSEGNLKAERTTTSFAQAYSSFSFDSGKWYAEFLLDTGNTGVGVIAGNTNPAANRYIGQDTYTYGFHYDGRKVNSASYTAYGSAYTRAADGSGDVVGVYIDADNGDIYFSVNGTVQNSGTAAFTGVTGPFRFAIGSESNAFHIANFGQDDTFADLKTSGSAAASDDNGNGVFYDAIGLSGYLAPCSANLPEPTIGPNSAEQADDYFNTVLYTGNGTDNTAITGVGFQPDWAWIKLRSSASSHVLHDSVRGANKQLFSNLANAEESSTTKLKSFDSDGFTLGDNSTGTGSVNSSGGTQVAWNWKAGGTAVSNTDGSITSQVSAAPDAGFSICTYTGTATVSESFGHGLNQAPELVITKARNTTDAWRVHGSVLGTDKFLALNSTNAVATDSSNGGFPDNTSTLVNLGYESTNGTNYVAYCFHSVDGYSKVGSYVGNGSTDGTFVYTGFRPSFILAKSLASGTSWFIKDSARSPNNVVNLRLYADASNAEMTQVTFHEVDFLSNGFKLRGNGSEDNGNGNTHIYLAFAEAPFKYANAR